MSIPRLARGLLELPKGTSTTPNENSNFMNNLERTNTLLVQFLSSTDNKKIMLRTELEESYFNLTIYNLRDSIKHKVEQDMWNNLFKKHVTDLQAKMKSKDKIEVTKTQSELSLFLDEAIGFYSRFLDILSLLHNIRLPGRQILDLSYKRTCKDNVIVDEVSEQDMCYIVQHCYVHLGDLSRYHNLNKLARLNYQLAVELNPQSGHAYNQLAILESSSMCQVLNHTNYSHLLRTILYYDYATSCQSPFPASRINLDSLLRRIHQESVSELLTSNNSTDNCVSSICVAWLHSYASMRLYNNIQRCRQLQQRIVEWASGLVVKHHRDSQTHWRDIATVTALQLALVTICDHSKDNAEITVWNCNLQQFTQELSNAICHGLVLISHDDTLFNSVLSEPGCVTVIVLFMTWLNVYMLHAASLHSTYLQRPFGEQFVKFLNILRVKIDFESLYGCEAAIKLPTDLPELHYLSGYEPLKVPSKKFDMFLKKTESKDELNDNKDKDDFRRGSFIIKVALRMAEKHSSLITYDVVERRFKSVQSVTVEESLPPTIVKKVLTTRRPVNVALSSFMTKDTSGNSNRSTFTVKVSSAQQTRNIEALSDVKLAKCIQEHIALETTNSLLSPVTDNLLISTMLSKEQSRAMAPAPGLILSSNLPADYKTMSAVVTVPDEDDCGRQQYHAPSKDVIDKSSSPQTIHAKLHSYNPNREQFEKDLPPRFANKRSSGSSQKDSVKSGFKSLNYWDSTNTLSNCETNLTKKESEMIMPPSVPSSWLSDNNDNHHVSMSSVEDFQMNNILNQRNTFNNESPQTVMNMFQPSFQQYQKSTMINDHESQLSHLLSQTTSSNLNNFSQHQLIHNSPHVNLGSMFMSQGPHAARSMHHNFPPIPPPPQQHSSSNVSSHIPHSTLNFHKFSPLSTANCYDKPIFSTNNHSRFDYSSIISQQQQQQPSPQHHDYNHQVRSHNPLLNLLPGFMNEMQR